MRSASTLRPRWAHCACPRAIHGLQRRGLRTVGDVASLSDTDLVAIRGIGPAAVAALRADLAARYSEERGRRER